MKRGLRRAATGPVAVGLGVDKALAYVRLAHKPRIKGLTDHQRLGTGHHTDHSPQRELPPAISGLGTWVQARMRLKDNTVLFHASCSSLRDRRSLRCSLRLSAAGWGLQPSRHASRLNGFRFTPQSSCLKLEHLGASSRPQFPRLPSPPRRHPGASADRLWVVVHVSNGSCGINMPSAGPRPGVPC